MIRQGALCGMLATVALFAAGGAPGPGIEPAATASGLGPRLRVTASWPRDKDPEVYTDVILVRFSRPLDFSSVTPATFHVYADAQGLIPGTLSQGPGTKGPDPRVIQFTPDAPLPRQGAFLVQVGMSVRSATGRELDEPVEIKFATAWGKDEGAFTPLGPKDKPRKLPSRGPAPKVRYTFPEAGFGNVFSDDVRVRFDRAMDANSITGSNFRVLDGGIPVPGTLTFPADDEAREVLFSPELPLFPDNTYVIHVTRSVRSAKGRYIKSEFKVGFGTSPLKEGTRPLKFEEFLAGPNLQQGRAFHTANAIPGGDVVLAGGQTYEGDPLASVEIFRRGTTSMFRAADMADARRKHASVTLSDGRVFVCGGFGPLGTTLASTEIYNPSSNSWFQVAPMAVGRANHTATLLPNGRILVVAGYTTDGGPLNYSRTAEVFSTQTNTWTTVNPPAFDRGGHTATLLPDGRVLIVGGDRVGQATAELYIPTTGAFRTTMMSPSQARVFHAAAVTRSGNVLLAGGFAATAEQFFPATETFAAAGGCANPDLGISEGALWPTLTLLPGSGGRLAYIGGYVDAVGLVSGAVQVWNPKGSGGAGSFVAMLFTMTVPRAAHTTTSLGDGRFLIAGGFGTQGAENEKRTTILAPEL